MPIDPQEQAERNLAMEEVARKHNPVSLEKRIATLEKRVEELQAKVEALERRDDDAPSIVEKKDQGAQIEPPY